jgi:hypothetical protein
MARLRRVLVCTLLALLLPACAGLGGPHTLTLGQADIDRWAERNFPLERRVLEVVELTLKAPRVSLLAERNRLAAVLDLQARDRLFGAGWQGQVSFDTALRWEATDQTVRLSQVRVQDLQLERTSAAARPAAERVAAVLAEQALEGLVLYRLPAERAAQMQRLGVAPSAVTVTARGVEITFAPLAR